jgi:hypothetical protein
VASSVIVRAQWTTRLYSLIGILGPLGPSRVVSPTKHATWLCPFSINDSVTVPIGSHNGERVFKAVELMGRRRRAVEEGQQIPEPRRIGGFSGSDQSGHGRTAMHCAVVLPSGGRDENGEEATKFTGPDLST